MDTDDDDNGCMSKIIFILINRYVVNIIFEGDSTGLGQLTGGTKNRSKNTTTIVNVTTGVCSSCGEIVGRG